ncbi:14-alpha sterol demethylase [Lophiostoma macrostomum CBS 122681]|uniref:14-alpha sterol demethylase n=1 Tax=Lophiostoma macrostomum CBS 122681 TaxID=1314788 RepID=A0A6A6SZW0_9PLEO|nr:14-alpha sterol demethylase [Lophiostoma macrostomum CBS 122681]
MLIHILLACVVLASVIIVNVLKQLCLRRKDQPPLVIHWIPHFGNAISYGINPYRFLADSRKRHGDIFTFRLFHLRITAYLGTSGNAFILNGSHSSLNAEDVYSPLTTPVFGKDVVYDCPNAKLMEQKKFIKFGLTSKALSRHVRVIEREVLGYITTSTAFGFRAKTDDKKETASGLGGEHGLKSSSGVMEITKAMAELTIFTAGRALQGAEVRQKLTGEMAELYHDLDGGFQPVNFLMPWLPLPANRRRDRAHGRMRAVYENIIATRRKKMQMGRACGTVEKENLFEEGEEGEEMDMIANLMQSHYKDGSPLPDHEIAHIMITLLMAGQHSSSSAASWIMLRLASRPDIQNALYAERLHNLGSSDASPLSPLQYEHLDTLSLLQAVIKETLRLHPSISSIMRKVTQPMRVRANGQEYVVDKDNVMLASPIVTALSSLHFADPEKWDPYRWLNNPSFADYTDVDVSVSKGANSPYLPFGAGRHRCIGEKFAYVNLGVIVATLIREFEWSMANGETGVPETDYQSLFARPKAPAMLRWRRRAVV